MKSKMISIHLLTLGLIVFTSNSLFIKGNFQNKLKAELIQKKEKDLSLNNKYFDLKDVAKKYHLELLRIEEERRIEELRLEEERIAKEEQLQNQKKKIDNSRGGSQKTKEVTCYITYYTNLNTRLQGGQYDKKGKRLTSHGGKVVACPSDIPYGSYLSLDGMGSYKVVDTGGAIKWLDSNKTKMKVDVFIPNVTVDWIIRNTNNKVVKGCIYYK